jgi:hypothetical protein
MDRYHRIIAIDEYNKPSSEKLNLPVDDGGLGINSTTVDIVVVHNSNWCLVRTKTFLPSP